MTTALTDPTPLDPGVGGRAYTWPELDRAGVVLEAEQRTLLLPAAADRCYVMCVVALPDPFSEARLRMLYPPKLRVFNDAHHHAGEAVVVPMFGQVDCSSYAVDQCDAGYGFHWRRFPSVPVQLYDKRQPHQYRLWPDMARVWNAWPVDVYDQAEIEEVTQRLMAWWAQLYQVSAVWFSDMDDCELVHGVGEHLHVPHPAYPESVVCRTGQSYLRRLREQLLWNDDVTRVRNPYTLLGFNWYSSRLETAWRRLVESSWRNTIASLDVAPPWCRDELASVEAEQTPWL